MLCWPPRRRGDPVAARVVSFWFERPGDLARWFAIGLVLSSWLVPGVPLASQATASQQKSRLPWQRLVDHTVSRPDGGTFELGGFGIDAKGDRLLFTHLRPGAAGIERELWLRDGGQFLRIVDTTMLIPDGSSRFVHFDAANLVEEGLVFAAMSSAASGSIDGGTGLFRSGRMRNRWESGWGFATWTTFAVAWL